MDERWDRLIVLSLDGELNDEQRLEFDRLVRESTEFRLRWEQLDCIDGYCRDAVNEALEEIGVAERVLALIDHPQPRRRPTWWALPVAAAACLALWFVWPQPKPTQQVAVHGQTNVADETQGRSLVKEAGSRPPRLISGSSMVDRVIDNDRLYVVGDDGNIYVIDQQSVQTARRAIPDGGIRQASYSY